MSNVDENLAPISGLAGLRVCSFESRKGNEMRALLVRQGAIVTIAPSMREIPLDQNPAAFAFAEQLFAGKIDLVLLLTGVGTKALAETLESRYERSAFFDALQKCTIVVRGPKPAAVLREWRVRIDHQVPEPNTWRELLALLDEKAPVAGKTVAVQEYGQPNPELYEGLTERRAQFVAVPVYRWSLPEDIGPLLAAIRATVAGDFEILMFTSAHQLRNVLEVAESAGLRDAWLAAANRCVVASIGPTASETLEGAGLKPDIEPEHPKMGHLVLAAARFARDALHRKRSKQPTDEKTDRPEPVCSPSRTLSFSPSRHSLNPARMSNPEFASVAKLHNSRFLKACRREPVDTTPVWIMRQAGRYLPEYMAVRSKVTFIELCKRPDLAAEVTLSAQKALGVDAAILFADLLPILEPMGLDLEYAKGEGPVIHNPVRTAAEVDRVVEVADMASLSFVFETVKLVRRDLPADIPLIGFAGAPFTLASYIIEGAGSKNYIATKRLMYSDAGAWQTLMQRLVNSLVRYLREQIAAGCQAVQLFDSWAGCLSPADYRQFVLPYTKAIIDGLPPDVPVINFLTGNPALLPLCRDAGGDVIGLDWRVDLKEGWRTVGHDRAVQGNLDPVLLMADLETLRRRTHDVLDAAEGRPGHIFNLGHGVMPEVNPDHVKALVRIVHERGIRR